MKCDDEALSAYMDGELTREETEAMNRHLKGCSNCAAALGKMQTLRAVMAGGASETFSIEALLDRVHSEGRKTAPAAEGNPIRTAGILLAVASVVIAVGYFVLQTAQTGDDGETVADAPGTGSPVARVPNLAPAAGVAPDWDEEALDAMEPAELEAGLETTTLALSLSGIMTGTNPVAVIKHAGDETQRSYAVGDEIIEGVVLEEVHPNYVVIDNNGVKELVYLLSADPDDPLNLDGYWNVDAGLGAERTQMASAVRIEEEHGILRFTSDLDLISKGLSGTRSGRDVRLVLDRAVAGAAEDLVLEGEFNDDGDSFSVSGAVLESEEAIALTDVVLTFTKSDGIKEQLEQDRLDEVHEMSDVLKMYANTFNRYPSTLNEPIPEYVSDLTLFENTETRTVVFTGGQSNGVMDNDPPGPDDSMWDERYPGMTYPDRLMAWEEGLKAAVGPGFPFAENVLEVTYTSPDQVYRMTVGGYVYKVDEDPLGAFDGSASEGDQVRVRAEYATLRASCANNLKQLGIAMKMFENAHDGYVFPGWLSAYPDYIGDVSILSCPEQTEKAIDYDYWWPATRFPQMYPQVYAQAEGLVIEEDYPVEFVMEAGGHVPVIVERHRHAIPGGWGKNVLFADGHVAFIKSEDLGGVLGPYEALR